MRKYKEYKDFVKNVPGDYPAGWNEIVQDAYSYVEKWNKENKTMMIICQIKDLNDDLFIYIEDLQYINPAYNALQIMVDGLCERARDICRVCGKQKVEIIIDSKIEKKCMDHYEN